MNSLRYQRGIRAVLIEVQQAHIRRWIPNPGVYLFLMIGWQGWSQPNHGNGFGKTSHKLGGFIIQPNARYRNRTRAGAQWRELIDWFRHFRLPSGAWAGGSPLPGKPLSKLPLSK